MNILFVCTGNTCRSPMAEFLFKKILKDKGKAEIEVHSAGVAPAFRLPFPPEASTALAELGVDNVNHKSKGLTPNMVEKADWILVMEEHHKESVVTNFPNVKEKVILLKEFAGTVKSNNGVPDPIGQSQDFYRKTLSEIKDALDKIVRKI